MASSSSPSSDIPPDVAALGGALALRNGSLFHWRAIHPDDAERLQAFHQRLSHQTLLFRFFGEMPVLSREFAGRLSHVDYHDRMAIVVTPGASVDEPIVAVARYEQTAPGEAEFALVIEDRWQGQGIGSQALRELARYARSRGYSTLIGNVMYENEHMLTMLRHLGIPAIHHLREGRVEVQLDISALDG
jgi:GNAT superfamily N-acetyltransferase